MILEVSSNLNDSGRERNTSTPELSPPGRAAQRCEPAPSRVQPRPCTTSTTGQRSLENLRPVSVKPRAEQVRDVKGNGGYSPLPPPHTSWEEREILKNMLE